MSSTTTGVTFNADAVLRTFSLLSVDEMRKVHRAALAKGARILVNETRLMLRDVTGRASSTRTADRRGWSKIKGRGRIGKLSDGVRMYVSRDSDFAKVHIMGDFRLKFFEMGTDPRETRKGYNRGKMFKYSDAMPFFSPAITVSKQKMADTIRKSIVDAVMKKCKQ